MALLPILCYPDPRLHKVAKPVASVDARVLQLVADLLETMYDAKGGAEVCAGQGLVMPVQHQESTGQGVQAVLLVPL